MNQIITLNEAQLKTVIKESVTKILNEISSQLKFNAALASSLQDQNYGFYKDDKVKKELNPNYFVPTGYREKKVQQSYNFEKEIEKELNPIQYNSENYFYIKPKDNIVYGIYIESPYLRNGYDDITCTIKYGCNYSYKFNYNMLDNELLVIYDFKKKTFKKEDISSKSSSEFMKNSEANNALIRAQRTCANMIKKYESQYQKDSLKRQNPSLLNIDGSY